MKCHLDYQSVFIVPTPVELDRSDVIVLLIDDRSAGKANFTYPSDAETALSHQALRMHQFSFTCSSSLATYSAPSGRAER